MQVVAKWLDFVMSYMKQNKTINKLSRVRSSDWKSALSAMVFKGTI